MSIIDLSSPRAPQDMGHLIYTCGDIGIVTTLSCIPVVAGDSFQQNLVGSFKLSPMRRNLTLDPQIDIVTFYSPHRHHYDNDWVTFMMDKASLKGTPNELTATVEVEARHAEALGLSVYDKLPTDLLTLPLWRFKGYADFFNNYVKHPRDGVFLTTPANFSASYDGMPACHLKAVWNMGLPSLNGIAPGADEEHVIDINTVDDNFDLYDVVEQSARWNTHEEKVYFANRYRDIVDAFGGYANTDVDQRPTILNRTSLYGSGYDVDGTSSDSLGQFAGRVAQNYKHSVPRWFVPEHGAIWTVMVVRYEPIIAGENHYLDFQATPTYEQIACDPVLVANSPTRLIDWDDIFSGAPTDTLNRQLTLPDSWWYREHPHFVNGRFRDLQGYPFLPTPPVNFGFGDRYVNPTQYDEIFQTNQLRHWNTQARNNVTILRNIPSTRDSMMLNG